MAGKGGKWRRGSGLDGSKNNPNASGQPASPCHAWGPPPRVVENPASPDCGIGGSPGRRKPSGWLPVHKNRCDCCPPAA